MRLILLVYTNKIVPAYLLTSNAYLNTMYAYLIRMEISMKVKTLRMPEWLEKVMEDLAQKGDRSFSKEAVRAMREYVERQGVKCPE